MSQLYLVKKKKIKGKGLNFSSKFQKARYLRIEEEKQLTLTSDTRIQRKSRRSLAQTPRRCKKRQKTLKLQYQFV